MLNLFNLIAESDINFGFGTDSGRPALFLFGVPIYLYGLIIVTGMCVAIIVAGLLLKRRGIDPYDVTIYALAVIPLGVLGARLYVYIFPWEGQAANWSTFLNFRGGGLGIYGGVIMGFLAALVTAKIKKQDFGLVIDCLLTGVIIAQSIGRWGNFANQEAFGNLVTDPNLQFFPYAVFIDARNAWYQATFFYESVATFVGFIICLLLFRSKHYKRGWISAFYGIYYGIVRLFVEGLRTDSLYLWIGTTQTDIKISQLVSVFTIILGLWTLSRIYRQQLHALYRRLFKSEYAEVSNSRFVLAGVVVAAAGVAVTMFVLGGASKFIIGVACLALSIYACVGIFALNDRLKLYIDGQRCAISPDTALPAPAKNAVSTVYAIILCAVLLILAVLFAVLGVLDSIPNDIVLSVIFIILFFAVASNVITNKTYFDLKKSNLKAVSITITSPVTGEQKGVALSPWLLTIFPFKTYRDFGVAGITPYVEVKPEKKRSKDEA
jgi:phosphatidylglycerol:prolipoprotein diacylglycerol transferase